MVVVVAVMAVGVISHLHLHLTTLAMSPGRQGREAPRGGLTRIRFLLRVVVVAATPPTVSFRQGFQAAAAAAWNGRRRRRRGRGWPLPLRTR